MKFELELTAIKVVFGELKEGKGIIRKIEGLSTQADKPHKDVIIVGKCLYNCYISKSRKELIRKDCGQISADEAASASKKEPDTTGDVYEDFPEDQGEDLKGPEIVEIATNLKDYGNKAFKNIDLDLALEKYQKGLRYLNEYPEAQPGDPPEIAKEMTHLRFTLHSNAALLQIKLKSFADAKSSAENALELDEVPNKDRAKASYRKALALLGLKDEEEAVKNLETAQKLAPGDVAISKELGAAKKKAAEHAKKEKAAYKKFFD